MSDFRATLSALGCSSYAQYLRSPHWITFREGFRACGRKQTCEVCGGREVSLHHVTYARLGREEVGDVMPLCDRHHLKVHAWLKRHGEPVESSLRAVSELRRRWVEWRARRGRAQARRRAR